ncbi:MAG: D-alanyl-D-alanine carboxypeptidase/D-alanyl-D-alanine-endopeptidase [Planctomycetes bacterium]|nr:D-alanyl-D-alanine carboxypeptidase/D-alanyl-D-alanine-endopeptidase [Planctomycetota bacterium]
MTRRLALVAGLLVLAPAPARGRDLDAEVDRLIARHGLSRLGVGVAIIDEGGRTACAINADVPFKPASNQKVLTTAAALHGLGADFRYETVLLGTGPVAGGKLQGDLVIRGGGDPNISGRFHGGDPSALLRRWARDLHAAGLREVTGDIVADDTLFDDERFPAVWDSRQQEVWYAAQVSALSINDNCADVTVRPGASPGKPARITVEPARAGIAVEGSVETRAGRGSRVIVHRKPGTNLISVRGEIGVRADPWNGNVTLDDPASVFACALEAALEGAGVTVRGGARKAERPAASGESGDAPLARPVPASAHGPGGSGGGTGGGSRGTVLLRHTSTLLEDLPVVLKRSQNLHAEILLKLLGARAGGEGSRKGGARAVQRYLEAKGIPAAGLVVADGSGLAHENRVTARVFARVLHAVRSEPYFERYLQVLPIAGKDGTLDDRFQGKSPARGNLYAKTGYIRGVSCLSG